MTPLSASPLGCKWVVQRLSGTQAKVNSCLNVDGWTCILSDTSMPFNELVHLYYMQPRMPAASCLAIFNIYSMAFPHVVGEREPVNVCVCVCVCERQQKGLSGCD